MPTHPRLTNPVYGGTKPTATYAVMCEAFPSEPTCCPALPPATHAPGGWAGPRLPPPLSRTQGCQPQRACPLARTPGHRPAPPRRHYPWGPRAGPGRHPHLPLRGSARAPPPPPGARGTARGARLPAKPECHHRYGGPPCATPPGTTRRHPGAQGPEPHPRLGAVARRVGRVARPPPAPVPVDGHQHLTARDHHPPQPPPLPPVTMPHGTANSTPLMH